MAGPEAANDAAALTHFTPMLTLGIPAGAAMALTLAALLIQGIQPGPQVMTKNPKLFWGVVASMWLDNMMLLVLNLLLVGVAAAFGVLGVVFKVLGCHPAPLMPGFVLGPVLEENLRRGLKLNNGDFSVFLTRPVSLALLVLTVALAYLFAGRGLGGRAAVQAD